MRSNVRHIAEGCSVEEQDGLWQLRMTADWLLRTVSLWGQEVLTAFAAYLTAARAVEIPDAGECLLVDEFAGRWLQENSPLTRNASVRAQRALVSSGLMATYLPAGSAGARGKSRAMIVCRADPHSENEPASPEVGKWVSAPVPHNRETGPTVSPQVDGAFPKLGERVSDTSTRPSSEITISTQPQQEVANALFGAGRGDGLLESVLVPDLTSGGTRGRRLLERLLGGATVCDRAEGFLERAGYPGGSLGRSKFLTDWCSDVLAGIRPAEQELAAQGVSGRPWGATTPQELGERVVVALLAGLDQGKIRSWGAWFHASANPGWRPLNTPIVAGLLTGLRSISEVPPGQNDLPGAGRPETEPEDPTGDVDCSGLSDTEVSELYEQLLKEGELPFLPAERSGRVSFQRAVVSDYLTRTGDRAVQRQEHDRVPTGG